jgi:hypothetical protein
MNTVAVTDSQITVSGQDDADDDILSTDFDTVALDFDIMSVLKNRRIKGDLKWLQYYNALERYLYKKDPSYKAPQFKFDVNEDSNGEVSFSLRRKKSTDKYLKLVRFMPMLIGPLITAAFTIFSR